MNWDWEKLQEKRQRQSSPLTGPDLGDLNNKVKQIKQMNFPGWRTFVLFACIVWLSSGIYIVEPDEVGVVKRFGAYDRTTESGPHYHLPFPIESVLTPKVTKIQRIEIGFRGATSLVAGSGLRLVPEESLMLTGDENIVDVQFIVQYLVDNAQDFLFGVANQEKTVKDAAEAAMREVIGYNKIDAALTDDKTSIQNDTKVLLQRILDSYKSGIRVVAVQLQDVHPPKQVVDAFKDVASAKEDKSRFINEAEAYQNDLMPRTRGEAVAVINQAQAYRESKIRQAQGESDRFLSVLKEYHKAESVTKKRIYIETMEEILSRPEVDKVILSDKSLERIFPYLPLQRSTSAGGNVQDKVGGIQ